MKEKGIPPISYLGRIIYSCKMIALRIRLEYAESTQFMREYVVVQAECDSKVRKTDGWKLKTDFVISFIVK